MFLAKCTNLLLMTLHFIKDNATATGSIATVCALFATLKNSKVQEDRFNEQLKQQKEQWLNDVYVKNEADILINFREKFINAHESMMWVLYFLLEPVKVHYSVTVAPRRLDMVKAKQVFNELNELNVLYNTNQHIFIKHDLKINRITVLLDVLTRLKTDDDTLNYRLVADDETTQIKEYRLLCYDVLLQTFVMSYSNGHYANFIELKEKMVTTMNDELISIQLQLDKLTTINSKSPCVTQKRFYNWH